jgi:sporulation protein YlmC with PRC-barrel domain
MFYKAGTMDEVENCWTGIAPSFQQEIPMKSLIFAVALATTALSSTAFAQNATPAGEWRASKLIGLNIYNEQNEKLGDINEILVDKAGKVDGVVIGVGGFLGMGEHDIKVSMDKLQFSYDAPRGSTAASSSSARPTNSSSTASNADTKSTSAASNTTTTTHKWYPDHAVLPDATKEKLKSMPQFKYD